MAVIRGEDFNLFGIEIAPSDDQRSVQGATYDVRIGDQILLWSTDFEIQDPSQADVMLEPGDVAVIKTYESVSTPDNIAGTVGSMVAWQAIGLVTAPTTIDPNFSGHLFVALFNHGRYPVPLRYKDELCSITFLELNHPTGIRFKRTQSFAELMEVFATKLRIILAKSRAAPAFRGDPFAELQERNYLMHDTFTLLKAVVADLRREQLALVAGMGRLQQDMWVCAVILKLFPWMVSVTVCSVLYAIERPEGGVFYLVAGVCSILSLLLNLFDRRLLARLVRSRGSLQSPEGRG